MRQALERFARIGPAKPHPAWLILTVSNIVSTYYFSPEVDESPSDRFQRSSITSFMFTYALMSIHAILYFHFRLEDDAMQFHHRDLNVRQVAQKVGRTRLAQASLFFIACTLVSTAKHYFLNVPTPFSSLIKATLIGLAWTVGYTCWHDKKVVDQVQNNYPDLRERLTQFYLG